MKKLLSLMLMLVLSVAFYGCSKDADVVDNLDYKVENAFVTIDINPSIEIITGEDGLVVQVNAINDDAQVLLVDYDYTGKTVEVVVDEIVELAMELGYIDGLDENAIVVTAEANDLVKTEELENKITERINKFSERKQIRMQVIKANQEANEEMKALAESLNISVGKLKLINVAMEFDDTLTIEAAASMSVRDLNRVVIDARNDMKELVSSLQRQNYLNLKNQLNESLFVNKVQFIYDAMLLADDEIFTNILVGSSTTVEEIKTLYKAYLDELLVVKNSTPEEAVQEGVNAEIDHDLEIIDLRGDKEELEQAIETLHEQFRQRNQTNLSEEVKNQLRTKLEETNNLESQIRTKIQEHVQEFARVHEYYKFNIEDIDGQLRVNVQMIRKAQYHETREKYEGLFLEIGIDLEALEELFIDDINEDLNEIRNQFNNQFAEIKSQSNALKTQYREQKQMYKDLWENNK